MYLVYIFRKNASSRKDTTKKDMTFLDMSFLDTTIFHQKSPFSNCQVNRNLSKRQERCPIQQSQLYFKLSKFKTIIGLFCWKFRFKAESWLEFNYSSVTPIHSGENDYSLVHKLLKKKMALKFASFAPYFRSFR